MIVLCPHFEPDTAPTGTVMTRIVAELVERGHTVHVVTSLPWYRHHRIEPAWGGRWVRREVTPWGSITRVHPFPGDDKSNLLRRAIGFLGYSALAGSQCCPRRRVGLGGAEAVIAMSPPLTLGLTGWIAGRVRRGPAGVQHPGRLPRRRGRDRGDHEPPRSSPWRRGSSA